MSDHGDYNTRSMSHELQALRFGDQLRNTTAEDRAKLWGDQLRNIANSCGEAAARERAIELILQYHGQDPNSRVRRTVVRTAGTLGRWFAKLERTPGCMIALWLLLATLVTVCWLATRQPCEHIRGDVVSACHGQP